MKYSMDDLEKIRQLSLLKQRWYIGIFEGIKKRLEKDIKLIKRYGRKSG